MPDHACTECGAQDWSEWTLHEEYEYGDPFIRLSHPVVVVNGVSTRHCRACKAPEVKVRAPFSLHDALAAAIVDNSYINARDRWFVRRVLVGDGDVYEAQWDKATRTYVAVWRGTGSD